MAGPGGTSSRGRIAALLFLLALALLALVVLRAYESHRGETVVAEVPLLRADPSPVRERPADPGGMQVPYQDSLILENLGEETPAPTVERLLPPPEQPLEPPVEQPVATEASAAPALLAPSPPLAPSGPEETAAALPQAPAVQVPPDPYAGFRVQVGSFRSREEAEAGWIEALANGGELLGGVGHVIAEVDLGADRGIFYRLQAGPLPSWDGAEGLCAELKVRQMDCFVVAP